MEENNKKEFLDSFRTKSFKAGGYSLLLTVIVIAVLLAVNFVVSVLPTTVTKIDISADDLYQISEETKEIVRGLKDEITVYQVATSGSENTVLSEFVNRYHAVNGRIRPEFKDPTLYPNFISTYTDGSLNENSLIVVNNVNGRSKVIDYNTIWYTDFSQMTEQEYYYYLQGYDIGHKVFAGEKELTSALDYVTSPNIPKICLTTDHGETELGTVYSAMLDEDNYEVVSLSVKADGIPADADVLIFNRPTLDITEDEVALLSDFMKAGGKLVLITYYENGVLPNLYSLGAAYGLNAGGGLVVEGSANYCTQYPYYLLPKVEKGAFLNAMNTSNPTVLARFSDGLTVSDPLPEGVTVTKLLTTSASAYLKAEISENMPLTKQEGDAEGPFCVGAMGMNAAEGGIVWFTSPDITFDSTVQYYHNGEFFMAGLSVLCKKDTSVAIAVREISTSNLMVTKGASNLWLVILVILVPVAVLVYGIVRWNKRRKR